MHSDTRYSLHTPRKTSPALVTRAPPNRVDHPQVFLLLNSISCSGFLEHHISLRLGHLLAARFPWPLRARGSSTLSWPTLLPPCYCPRSIPQLPSLRQSPSSLSRTLRSLILRCRCFIHDRRTIELIFGESRPPQWLQKCVYNPQIHIYCSEHLKGSMVFPTFRIYERY